MYTNTQVLHDMAFILALVTTSTWVIRFYVRTLHEGSSFMFSIAIALPDSTMLSFKSNCNLKQLLTLAYTMFCGVSTNIGLIANIGLIFLLEGGSVLPVFGQDQLFIDCCIS